LQICHRKHKIRDTFAFVFQAAERAGWLSTDDNAYPKASHVAFGLVLGEDGKRFRTRNTEVVRLVDLLDEAKSRSKATLIERGMILNDLSFVLFVLNVGSFLLSLFLICAIMSMRQLLFYRCDTYDP
jgi:hypothetical protein